MIHRCFVLAIASMLLCANGFAQSPGALPAQECSSYGTADESTDAKAVGIDDLKWLAGAWASDDRGSSTEEHWIAPKGGIMLGVNRGVSRNGKASFEFLRIAETREGIVYFASPGGKEPTPFRLKEAVADSVTFENPDHDFPQRVVYRKVEGNLVARIEGSINGKDQSMEWTWKPVAE